VTENTSTSPLKEAERITLLEPVLSLCKDGDGEWTMPPTGGPPNMGRMYSRSKRSNTEAAYLARENWDGDAGEEVEEAEEDWAMSRRTSLNRLRPEGCSPGLRLDPVSPPRSAALKPCMFWGTVNYTEH
jgi:hypothetical protein